MKTRSTRFALIANLTLMVIAGATPATAEKIFVGSVVATGTTSYVACVWEETWDMDITVTLSGDTGTAVISGTKTSVPLVTGCGDFSVGVQQDFNLSAFGDPVSGQTIQGSYLWPPCGEACGAYLLNLDGTRSGRTINGSVNIFVVGLGESGVLEGSFDLHASKSVVIDPGHGQILTDGVLKYQRPPSPTYQLVEDVLTLEMSKSVQAELQAAKVTVYLTRETDKMAFPIANCGVPCLDDIDMRAEWAEKMEPDLIVSVHTNAGAAPTANGSLSFYSSLSKSPDSSQLAQFVLSRVVALGLNNQGVTQKDFNILAKKIPGTIIEVAFHTNSQLAPGQAVTDEERLNDPAFRGDAAKAIANGIEDYYAAK